MEESGVAPHIATPRSQLKRKHGEIVDLTASDDESGTAQVNEDSAGGDRQPVERRLDDDEFEGDDASLMEDILDEIELNPYVAGTT